MNRRGFLKKVTGGAAVAAGAAAPYGIFELMAPPGEWPARNRLRPPGAIKDDASFATACIGCGLCGEVCPPRCIAFQRRDGGIKVNLPYIDAEAKGCILCGKCMDVCPTVALTPTPVRDVDMGIAQIDRAACYPWVDRGVCGACVTICPLGEGAIGFDFANIYRPVVKNGCVGCGLCVEVCPHPSKPIWIVDRKRGTVVQHSV